MIANYREHLFIGVPRRFYKGFLRFLQIAFFRPACLQNPYFVAHTSPVGTLITSTRTLEELKNF